MAVKVKLIEPVIPVVSGNIGSINSVDLIKSVPSEELKAYYENPIRMASAMDYKEKPSSLSYNILYQMSVKNSVIAAVINTRVNQVSTFTKPKRFSSDGVGFEVRLRDPSAVPTEEQQEIIQSIEKFLENCGYYNDNSTDDFDTFIRKIVRDSLTFDQVCFEIVPDRKNRPAQILAVDASTIRAASEHYNPSNHGIAKSEEDVAWVQVIDGTVMAWFTSEEMAFGVRNPRSNINLQPYGFSELEQLIQQITSHLYAEEYNSKFFSQGGTTKGIINIKADPNGIGNKEQLDSFKRQWRAQVNGMSGAWKTPVLQVPDGIEYLNVSQSNRDMEFNQWMNYLINIVCAVYAIDPAEINFANNGGAAGQSSVFESSQEQKLKSSKDKGLKPLLRFIETIINKYIISRFSQEFVFAFTGLDEKSEEEKAELESKQARVWKTVNEIRKEHGEQPIENGDVILDPSWINFNQQQLMMKQQQEMGGGDYDSDSEYEDEDKEEDEDSKEESYQWDEDSEDNDEEQVQSDDNDFTKSLSKDGIKFHNKLQKSKRKDCNTEKSLSKLIIKVQD